MNPDRRFPLNLPEIVIYLIRPYAAVFYLTKSLVIKLGRLGGSSIGVVIDDVLEFFAAIEIPLAEQ